jgi:hypothetical protein
MPNTNTPPKELPETPTPLFIAYLKLKKPKEFRQEYTEHFGWTERTLYNRMTPTGVLECSEAEIAWFCNYFQISRKKLFPQTLKQAA